MFKAKRKLDTLEIRPVLRASSGILDCYFIIHLIDTKKEIHIFKRSFSLLPVDVLNSVIQ